MVKLVFGAPAVSLDAHSAHMIHSGQIQPRIYINMLSIGFATILSQFLL